MVHPLRASLNLRPRYSDEAGCTFTSAVAGKASPVPAALSNPVGKELGFANPCYHRGWSEPVVRDGPAGFRGELSSAGRTLPSWGFFARSRKMDRTRGTDLSWELLPPC